MEKLTEIEKSLFFDNLANIIYFADTEVSLAGFNISRKEMKQHVEEFKKLCFFTDSYFIEEIEAGEKAIIHMIKNDTVNSLSSLENINKKIHRENLRAGIEKVFPDYKISEESLNILYNKIYNEKKEL